MKIGPAKIRQRRAYLHIIDDLTFVRNLANELSAFDTEVNRLRTEGSSADLTFSSHFFKYRSATHPDLKTVDSTSFNCNLSCRIIPSNNLRPSPTTIG